MQELRLGHRIVYEVKANWKIVVENYNECLHCPQIHPELVSVIPLYRFGEVWDDDSGDVGNRMVPDATNFSVNGKSTLPQLPGLDPDDYHMYQGSYEFPNLMVNLHPDGMMSYIAFPKGPNHTTIISEFFYRPETIAAPDFDPSGMVEFWDLVNGQDWAVCEGVQSGMTSRRFKFGWYAPMEDMSLDIRRYVGERLGEVRLVASER